MAICCYIVVIFCIKSYFSFKIGTYNTHLAQEGGFESPLETFQVNELSASDIDVICLQELFFPDQAARYQTKLNLSYPHSFSAADSFDETPKIPCSEEQIALLSHQCVQGCAAATWPDGQLFAFCMGTNEECRDNVLIPLLYTSCLNCIGFCADPQNPACSENIQIAMGFCGTQTLPPLEWIDGTVILSEYPIINKWSFNIPSWLSQRAISIVEIDVCSVTNSNSNVAATKRLLSSDGDESDDDESDDDSSGVCQDTIIVGCVHLKDSDQLYPVNTFFPTSEDQVALGIISHIELNAYQSTYILENVLHRDVAPWIHDSDDNNVIAVFVPGDFNVGKLLHPDNFAIWENEGFISGRDVRGLSHIDNRGTYNADPNSELPNKLAYEFCTENFCFTQDSDFDHVLVKSKRKHHHRHGGGGNTYNVRGINGISYNRVFTDLFDVNGDGNNIPLSDHWGVQFEFEFKKKKSD